jgi:hypothetical protein
MTGSGRQPYGVPGYGAPGYGQQPYAAPGYPPPDWQPPGEPTPSRNHVLLVSLIAGGVAILAAAGVVLWLALGRDGIGAAINRAASATASAGGGAATATTPGDPAGGSGPGLGGATVAAIPPATVPPTGLGSDQVLNGYAQDCYHGNMVSCDIMYVLADQGTSYSSYGDTCAGRQPENTDRLCEEAFPG